MKRSLEFVSQGCFLGRKIGGKKGVWRYKKGYSKVKRGQKGNRMSSTTRFISRVLG
jgi:hypothetical protein